MHWQVLFWWPMRRAVAPRFAWHTGFTLADCALLVGVTAAGPPGWLWLAGATWLALRLPPPSAQARAARWLLMLAVAVALSSEVLA